MSEITFEEIVSRIRRPAEQGDADAQYELGELYFYGTYGINKDDVEAARWFRKSANQGCAKAQYILGWMYEQGRGVTKDNDEGAKWKRKAAEQGHASAQYSLGLMATNGQGTPKNIFEGVSWFQKAAKQGHAKAQLCLGWCYANATGVEKNAAEAIKWYRMAAEQGDPDAQFNLGCMYRDGDGVAKDLPVAESWFAKAAKNGKEQAKGELKRLKSIIPSPALPGFKEPERQNNDKHVRKRNMQPQESTEQNQSVSECSTLMDACTWLVYRNNSFRISGLHADATTREIKRRIDDLKAAEEMGDAEGEHTHAFALKPPPGIEGIREAAQRLQDPERRLVEEFFWFWPYQWGEGKTDEALQALSNGDKDAAFKTWQDSLKADDEREKAVAKHNLAVMYHMVALDFEYDFIHAKTAVKPERLKQADEYWHICFQYWEDLVEDEAFWSLVSERIRMADDPRLTTGFGRRMRSTFPLAFDRINATIAIQYAEKHQYEMARRHVKYMNETHQGMDDVDSTISLIVKPIEGRVNSAVEHALAAARKDAKSSAKVAKDLMDATEEPLAIIKSLLDEGHAIRSYLFEQVTDSCFTCLIAYGNETSDWPTCIALLEKTETFAITEESRKKIRANIKTAKNNHEQKKLREMCWFCKKAKATDAGKLDLKMYGQVERIPIFNGTRILWKNITVPIPRCDSCRQIHSKSGVTWGGALAGAAAGTAVVPILGTLIGLGIGAFLGGKVDEARRPSGVSPASAANDFPAVKELVAEGWTVGDKPPS